MNAWKLLKGTNWSSLKCLLDCNNTKNIVAVLKQVSYHLHRKYFITFICLFAANSRKD